MRRTYTRAGNRALRVLALHRACVNFAVDSALLLGLLREAPGSHPRRPARMRPQMRSGAKNRNHWREMGSSPCSLKVHCQLGSPRCTSTLKKSVKLEQM